MWFDGFATVILCKGGPRVFPLEAKDVLGIADSAAASQLEKSYDACRCLCRTEYPFSE